MKKALCIFMVSITMILGINSIRQISYAFTYYSVDKTIAVHMDFVTTLCVVVIEICIVIFTTIMSAVIIRKLNNKS